MNIRKKLAALFGIVVASSGAVPPAVPASMEQAVIVHFSYGSTDLQRLFDLESRLEAAISQAGAGEYDGNELAVDGSDGYIYMYGPSADRLFEVVKPILDSTAFMSGAKAKKRYGPPREGVKEVILVIQPPQ